MNNEFQYLETDENRVQAIRQVVQTVCIFAFRDVTGRELDLLCELVRCGGVNEKAKKGFLVNYKTTKENYGQLIKRLGDKGILEVNPMRNGKILHTKFLKLLELYLENPNEHYIIIKWNPNL